MPGKPRSLTARSRVYLGFHPDPGFSLGASVVCCLEKRAGFDLALESQGHRSWGCRAGSDLRSPQGAYLCDMRLIEYLGVEIKFDVPPVTPGGSSDRPETSWLGSRISTQVTQEAKSTKNNPKDHPSCRDPALCPAPPCPWMFVPVLCPARPCSSRILGCLSFPFSSEQNPPVQLLCRWTVHLERTRMAL